MATWENWNRKSRYSFFCPLCGHHQKTNAITTIGWVQHAQIALATGVFTIAFWALFGPKGLSSYILFWTLAELFARLRKRQALVCQECGFDPFWYKRDIDKMRTLVRERIQQRIQADPRYQKIKFKNYQTMMEKVEGSEADAAAVVKEALANHAQGENELDERSSETIV